MPLIIFRFLLPCLFILAASLSRGASTAAAAPRFDEGFGQSGRVAVELGWLNSANAVLVQPDGKIVVAGSVNPGKGKSFALVRFNPDGSLDNGFHHEGALISSLSLGDDEALALALLPDGRLVAGGYSFNGASRDFALACYLPNGELDLDFGLNGVTLTPVSGGDDEITALTVDTAGRIVAAGNVSGANGSVAAAARYDSYGVLDAAFGERGISLVGVGGESRVEGIACLADGALVLSGTFRRGPHASLMLIGLDSQGLLDQAFGKNGVALPAGSGASEGYRLAADKEGRLYVAGAAGEMGQRDSALFRFFPNGAPDPDFGRAGVVINQASAEDDVLFDVAIGENGLVACGFAQHGGKRRFLVASYSPDNGQPGFSLPVVPLEGGGKHPHLSAKAKKKPRNFLRKRRPAVRKPSETAPEKHSVAPPPLPNFQRGAPLSEKKKLAMGLTKRLANFFLPDARAEEPQAPGQAAGRAPMPSTDTAQPALAAAKGKEPQKAMLFSFGEGEGMGYAAALDAQGNAIVAGAMTRKAGSSMAITRITAASLYTPSSFVNQGLGESPALLTQSPTLVTQNSALCGGKVLPALNHQVRERGIAFCMRKNQAAEKTEPFSQDEGPASRERGSIAAGAGFGPFQVRLSDLVPGAWYSVRSYAITEGGSVYYGPEQRFQTADACFVATAAFGSIEKAPVILLRQFRDTMLNTTAPGRQLTGLYYRFSPRAAHFLERHPACRPLAIVLLAPAVAFAWLALHAGLAPALALGLLPPVTAYRLRRKRRAGPSPVQGQRGFTLIEVMVVMVILALLAAIITPRIMDRPEEARRSAAEIQIRALEQALKLYRLDNGRYPTTEQGLQALVVKPASGPAAKKWRDGGYLERAKVPQDPWGADYVYLCPGLHGEFDLLSYGADNQSGGDKKDKDVNNWELQ